MEYRNIQVFLSETLEMCQTVSDCVNLLISVETHPNSKTQVHLLELCNCFIAGRCGIG